LERTDTERIDFERYFDTSNISWKRLIGAWRAIFVFGALRYCVCTRSPRYHSRRRPGGQRPAALCCSSHYLL